ncbi:hypothetical protein M430DRAFT_175197 [Amorphotheca resinae ATCC 22711]|uniref:Uncharacterized protein n=1 Tax=Amorphotheca resinae ATCC 22711 TaxID=857342 RepID=A0A2T3ASQ1_AMORE|nr:hypothetical protein M430DRAFT_175197 [Amorphotheca resinae ATCC 22711]PSS10497.1 hypothetical protein M430DRAFT_175197 [Amorphotheca resinae ATCC 22711]
MSHEPPRASAYLTLPYLTLPYLIVPISLPSLFALLAHSSRQIKPSASRSDCLPLSLSLSLSLITHPPTSTDITSHHISLSRPRHPSSIRHPAVYTVSNLMCRVCYEARCDAR